MLTKKEQLIKNLLISIETGKPMDFTVYIDKESAMLFVDCIDKEIVDEMVIHEDLEEIVMISVGGENVDYSVYVENIHVLDRNGCKIAVEHEIETAFICKDIEELEYIQVLFKTQRHQADKVYLIDC